MTYDMKSVTKRMLALIISLMMVLSLLPFSAIASNVDADETGNEDEDVIIEDGSEENPYLIKEPQDFDKLRQFPDARFEIVDHINMDDIEFETIEEPFTGTLDGGGYSITNLTIEGEASALFYHIADEGENEIGIVKNIIFRNVDITGTVAAATVACINEGYVSNVKVESGTITADERAGGLVSRLSGENAYVQKSGNMASVSAKTAGGLVGLVQSGIIQDSFTGAEVSAPRAQIEDDENSDDESVGDESTEPLLGAVFGESSANSAAFSANDVFYLADDVETATEGNYTYSNSQQGENEGETNNNEDGDAESENIGFFAVYVPDTIKLVIGEEGTNILSVSDDSYTSSLVSYATSAENLLSVDEDTGEYEALEVGQARYYMYITCGDTAYKNTRTYTLPVDVKIYADDTYTDIDNDNSDSDNSDSNSSDSDSSDSDSSDSDSSGSDSSGSDSSDSDSSDSDSSDSDSSDSDSSDSDSSDSDSSDSDSSGSDSSDSDSSDSDSSDSDSSDSDSSDSDSSDSDNSDNEQDTEDEDETQAPNIVESGNWVIEGSSRTYVLSDGTKAVGPQTIEGVQYIFDENGEVLRYDFMYDNAWFMAKSDGSLYSNGFLIRTNSITFYAKDGGARTGWISGPDGVEYYQDVSSTGGAHTLATGVKAIDGKTYLFADDGGRETGTGWVDGVYLTDGFVATGRQVIDGKTYIIGTNGLPMTGDFTYEGTSYYAGETESDFGIVYLNAIRTMADGALRYYDENGQLASGWVDYQDARYYQTDEYVLLTGRQQVENSTYFFGSDGKLSENDGWAGDYYVVDGKALVGMQEIEEKSYYFDESGLLVKGVFTLDGAKYFAGTDGVIVKNAVAYDENGTGTYYGEDGKAIAEGFIDYDGATYYQKADATLAVGKLTIGENIYFFDTDGKQQTGTGWADVYYLEDGVAVTGVKEIDGETYIFGTDGVLFKGEFTFENESYFADETGKVHKNYFNTRQDGTIAFYGETGAAPVGWFDYADNRYYQSPQIVLTTGKATVDGETYYFNSDGSIIKASWLGDLYIQNGQFVTGPQTIDGKKYIFSEIGVTYKHNFTYEGNKYSADGKGVLYTNAFQTVSGVTTYYDFSGKAPIGWITLSDSSKYYQNEQYQILKGPQSIDGDLYFFGSDGKLVTEDGWAGDYYVIDSKALVGFQLIDGKDYYFNEDGLLLRGEFVHDGDTYRSSEDGVLYKNAVGYGDDGVGSYYGLDGKVGAEGWYELAEGRYYQTADLVLATGKVTIDGEIYFFAADGKQQTGTGWADVYYLNNGVAVTGIQEIDGATYIFNSEGIVQKGNFEHGGAYYSAGETGAIVKLQFVTLEDGSRRYLGETGAAPIGFIDVNGSTYYQNDKAIIVTGRVEIDGTTYYFNDNGEQQTGTGWVDGYYLVNGVPVTGMHNIGSSTYVFGTDGLVLTGEFTFEGNAYCAKQSGELYKDAVYTRENGTKVYFNSNGVAIQGWVESKTGNTYYQTVVNGAITLSQGFVTIDGSTYYFDSNGKLFKGNTSGWYTINGKQYYILSDGRYCEPPTISAVDTLYDAQQDIYSITISSKISSASGAHPLGSYSFDGGISWQTSNVKTVAGSSGVSLPVGKIMVRDAVGQSVIYSKAITLAPVVELPSSNANSGIGSYGIDVSMHNGYVNWQQVAASGIDYAIIRATSANNDGYYVDPYYEQNVRGAKAAGLDVGVYIYSYANDYGDVQDEVNLFLNCAETKRLKADGIIFDYPVYVDFEDKINLNGTDYNSRTNIVRYMMTLLEQGGYYPGFYTYESFMNYFNVAQLVAEGYPFWYARYPSNPNPLVKPTANGGVNFDIWQYTSTAYVPGVSGNCDKNYTYNDLPSKVHEFYGVTGGESKPTGGVGVVYEETLTVYDEMTNKYVTDDAATILAKVVQTEVSGFNNAEVYKAQAVAAHSYIMYQMQGGGTASVILATNPSSSVTAAVNEVVSEIVTYNNVVANTLYSAANSGTTQSSAAMWGGSYPYLVAGINSPGDLTATLYSSGGTSWQNRSNTVKLETAINNIEKLVPGSTAGRTDYENWITNPEYDANGYLTYITVMGTRIRAGKFYDNFWGLYSPNFTMNYNGNGTWTFVTNGNGHCVGMSQWGAYGMAKEGYTYDEILAHYFPGTQLKALY